MLTVSTYNNNVNSVNIFYDMKYHHGDLKGALVKSACIVCEKSGYEKLSLRSIAKEANVSQTAPYRHFKTKQDLLAEVAKCGFEELRQNMKKSLQKNKDLNAKEKFIEMGMEYLNFGLNKQKTFDLMNHADLYFPDFPELEKSANSTFALLVDGMLNLMPNLSEDELKSECIKNWAMITGLVSILRKETDEASETPAGIAIDFVKKDVKKFLETVISS